MAYTKFCAFITSVFEKADIFVTHGIYKFQNKNILATIQHTHS